MLIPINISIPKIPEKKLAVNLIPKAEIQKRSWEKFLRWVLTYGRYIIIGTEVIVLVAFLARFKLDRDFKTLSDDIKNKQAIIESYKDVEDRTHYMQSHLAVIKSLQNVPAPTKAIESLALLTPPDVIFDQLKISSGEISLSATAFTIEGFATFLEGLKRAKDFSNISLEKVEENASGIEFSLKVNYLKK